MFKKIVVRNVGILRAFDTPNAPKLERLSLFYARNGRGKSTLTAVMRAARDGCASTVLARTSLGNGGAAPEVTLVGNSANLRFANGMWDCEEAPIEVFDAVFITDNICAGELVELAQDRGLFSIIIGKAGVKLARHLERFNAIAKSTGIALKNAETALNDDIPTDMSKEEFFLLGSNPSYAKRLDAAERALKAVQQASKIATLSDPRALTKPELPAGLSSILGSTVADIDTFARERLLDHFKRFKLDSRAEAWVNYGVDHIHDQACPFCGREDVDAQGMVTLYGKIFGETYKAHLKSITDMSAEVDECLGEVARAELASRISTNITAMKKWEEYVQLDRELPDTAALADHLIDAHKRAKALLDQKRAAPLEVVNATAELAAIDASLEAANKLIDEYNAAVMDVNNATAKATAEAAPMTLDDATKVRDNIKRRMNRQDPGVERRAATYLRTKKRDERARKMRTEVQSRLKKANEHAADHYHAQVNHYLRRFRASFAISKITNSMQGNAGQSDYALVIKGETVARQRGRSTDSEPSFRNTLSAGDKTTLALAFFLAKLDHDQELCEKTLIIDDPLSSHDSYRRRETVGAIKELCGRCQQVIVLSHDEQFLREIERRCSGIDSAAFQIDYANGDEWSVASAVDLDLLCRAGHAKMIDEIKSYVDHREGTPDDVVLKIRQVLETHYRRSYSGWFSHDQNLGGIVAAISAEGPDHPCYRDLRKLDNCNDATCDKHHGDDALITLKRAVDPDELAVIAVDALELIGARRPVAPLSSISIASTLSP